MVNSPPRYLVTSLVITGRFWRGRGAPSRAKQGVNSFWLGKALIQVRSLLGTTHGAPRGLARSAHPVGMNRLVPTVLPIFGDGNWKGLGSPPCRQIWPCCVGPWPNQGGVPQLGILALSAAHGPICGGLITRGVALAF